MAATQTGWSERRLRAFLFAYRSFAPPEFTAADIERAWINEYAQKRIVDKPLGSDTIRGKLLGDGEGRFGVKLIGHKEGGAYLFAWADAQRVGHPAHAQDDNGAVGDRLIVAINRLAASIELLAQGGRA